MVAFNQPGDIALDAGATDFVFGDSTEALVQQMASGLLIIPGTWKFDLKAGFELFELSFVTTWRLPFLEGELRRYFLGFADVREIESLSVSPVRTSDTEVLAQVTFSLILKDGSKITNQDVYLPLLASL